MTNDTSTLHPDEVTRAEVIVTAVSDLFRGAGEILASPIGVIPGIGVRLARLTHSPELLLSDGESTLFADTPAIDRPFAQPEGYLPYSKLFNQIFRGKRYVIMGAAQIDRYGNQNLSAIGRRDQPTKQLLGARAAATNSVSHAVSYWVPRHLPRVFVPRVDIITGVGAPTTSGARKYHDLRYVISELGVFDFSGPDGSMSVVTLHPGVSLDRVMAQTGFPLALPISEPATTRLPTPDELTLIRERIDPRNKRDKEVMQS